jgi:hypothetical protein
MSWGTSDWKHAHPGPGVGTPSQSNGDGAIAFAEATRERRKAEDELLAADIAVIKADKTVVLARTSVARAERLQGIVVKHHTKLMAASELKAALTVMEGKVAEAVLVLEDAEIKQVEANTMRKIADRVLKLKLKREQEIHIATTRNNDIGSNSSNRWGAPGPAGSTNAWGAHATNSWGSDFVNSRCHWGHSASDAAESSAHARPGTRSSPREPFARNGVRRKDNDGTSCQFHTLTPMKRYCDVSLEELRWKDIVSHNASGFAAGAANKASLGAPAGSAGPTDEWDAQWGAPAGSAGSSNAWNARSSNATETSTSSWEAPASNDAPASNATAASTSSREDPASSDAESSTFTWDNSDDTWPVDDQSTTTITSTPTTKSAAETNVADAKTPTTSPTKHDDAGTTESDAAVHNPTSPSLSEILSESFRIAQMIDGDV